MDKWYKTKITVLHKFGSEDFFNKYVNEEKKLSGMMPFCEKLPDNAEYILERPHIPEGFCDWAWSDIHRDVITIMSGGSFPSIKQDGVQVACCSDGLRPVAFLIERIE